MAIVGFAFRYNFFFACGNEHSANFPYRFQPFSICILIFNRNVSPPWLPRPSHFQQCHLVLLIFISLETHLKVERETNFWLFSSKTVFVSANGGKQVFDV